MSELPAGLQPAEEVVPRDSGSVVVLRQGEKGREVLLGVRSRKSRFMPGHWAFPGGVMEEQDAGGFDRCAVRELQEETGLEIPVEQLMPIGERITPPMFPVRFKTVFFVAEIDEPRGELTPPTSEIEELMFVRPDEVVERWSRGGCAVPPPVLPLLRALVDTIDRSHEEIVEALTAVNALEQATPRIEFIPEVWMLPVKTATMPPATHTNVWMPGGERFVVIDPGMTDESERERLFGSMRRRIELGQPVEAVLLTHRHQDHISGVADLCAAFDLPLYAHPFVLEHPAVAAVADRRPLEDGAVLDLGGLQLRAHYTPGHDPGHIAYEGVDRGWVVVGDLISGISTILIEPQTGDMDDYLESLEKMRRGGFRQLLPGHGPPLPAKAFDHLIAHRLKREQRVLDGVAASTPIADIARLAYADQPGLPQRLIELQTRAHLKRLERLERVTAEVDDRWSRLESTAATIERKLRDAFKPEQFELQDDSAQHAGHRGATSGGGHFQVKIVSDAFDGMSRLERHRAIYAALNGMVGNAIHALAIQAQTPKEL